MRGLGEFVGRVKNVRCSVVFFLAEDDGKKRGQWLQLSFLGLFLTYTHYIAIGVSVI